MEILVRRQPVFDRSEQLYGYELLLQRIGERPSGAEPPPEQMVVDVFLGIGLDQVAADHRAFITVDRDILLGDAVRLLPKDRVVLQLVGPLSDDDELLDACDRLVWRLSLFGGERRARRASGETPSTQRDREVGCVALRAPIASGCGGLVAPISRAADGTARSESRGT
jgi:hypothetical protein